MFALSVFADVRAGSSRCYYCDNEEYVDGEARRGWYNKVAGQRERHDIMVEQANKECLPAIVLSFCSRLGNVSPDFLWHTDHTHTWCSEKSSAVATFLHLERRAEHNVVVNNPLNFQ